MKASLRLIGGHRVANKLVSNSFFLLQSEQKLRRAWPASTGDAHKGQKIVLVIMLLIKNERIVSTGTKSAFFWASSRDLRPCNLVSSPWVVRPMDCSPGSDRQRSAPAHIIVGFLGLVNDLAPQPCAPAVRRSQNHLKSSHTAIATFNAIPSAKSMLYHSSVFGEWDTNSGLKGRHKAAQFKRGTSAGLGTMVQEPKR
ncbi:MAG: hypothetical protein ACI8W8_004312 [Rhodothermales bacterium]